jgi:hypothetical protein
MVQGTIGRLRAFEDFVGIDDPVAAIIVGRQIGDFKVVGQGVAEVDSGAPRIAGVTGGAVRFTTTNETEHTYAMETNSTFSAAANGTLTFEARVQFNNTATKETFIGFTDIAIASDVPSLETDLMTGATTTLTLTASDIFGFYQSADLTAVNNWHTVHNGGTTAGVTASGSVVSTAITAGEWQVLRGEVDTNGTGRWYIDGVLVKTLAGAVAPATVLKFMCGVEAKGAAVEELDVDYLEVTANRDWTV